MEATDKAKMTTGMTGEVVWFSAGKGFGFIAREDGEDDLFVHFSVLKMDGYKTLKEKQRVRFDIGRGPKGIQAENVEVIG